MDFGEVILMENVITRKAPRRILGEARARPSHSSLSCAAGRDVMRLDVLRCDVDMKRTDSHRSLRKLQAPLST